MGEPVVVDSHGAAQQAFLLKVPEHVFRYVCDASADDHLGDVELEARADGAEVPKRLLLNAINTPQVPLPAMAYDVRTQPAQAAPVHTFTEHASFIAIDSTVRTSGTVQMPLTKETRMLLQKRKAQAEQADRIAVQVSDETLRAGTLLEQRSKTTKAARIIREKMDEGELRTEILSLFSNQPFWALKDLCAAVNQSEAQVKQVLQHIADRHQHGDEKGRWELKESYRV
mmetsp:Transcript_16734/g.41179  ORF Transcript_16734/g.41179 Transcript_16734/m.41179 type:complete len:228 (-) Transcript_16734:316-999(-)